MEDTKAGKGERGHLMITTYRVIWASHSASINLSIGIGTVHKLTYKGGFGTHGARLSLVARRLRLSQRSRAHSSGR